MSPTAIAHTIAESVRAVMRSNGYTLGSPDLDEALAREAGNNAAGIIVIEQQLDAEEQESRRVG